MTVVNICCYFLFYLAFLYTAFYLKLRGIKLISFWDFLHHQGNCTSRQVICRKTVPELSLYSLNILQCSRLLPRLARVIEKNTTRWNITRNPPAFCYHLHGYSAKPPLFRKFQGVYLRPSRSCHVPLNSNYFPFPSGFICISMPIIVTAWKTISKPPFWTFTQKTSIQALSPFFAGLWMKMRLEVTLFSWKPYCFSVI